MRDKKAVLVLGGGISGMTAAQRLSQAQMRVFVIEAQPTIGGRIVQMGCKATDVCLHCNLCAANELLRNASASPDIRIYTRTELAKLETGRNGSKYTATLTHRPTFIDRDKCTGCLACVSVCPENCIARPQPALAPAVPVLDYANCRLAAGKKCSACKKACPADAINMDDRQSHSTIDVDCVVIAVGYEPYDPAVNASYGYGRAANIITGVEVERQLAAAGKITRPSDGQPAKRVAFVQCVGSRSEQIHRRPEDTDYCSEVCCAYALRIAQLLKYHNRDAELTVFYMDIQNFGKGFDDFYKKCKENATFIRSRPYELRQGPDDSVRVRYAPQSLPAEAQVVEQEFDLVVLAVGIRPANDTEKLAQMLLVPVDRYGFFGLKGASSLPQLQREGIYAIGACESPKDIESCMRQAEAVSAAIINGF